METKIRAVTPREQPRDDQRANEDEEQQQGPSGVCEARAAHAHEDPQRLARGDDDDRLDRSSHAAPEDEDPDASQDRDVEGPQPEWCV